MNEFDKWLKAQGIEDFATLAESVQKTLKASFELTLQDPGDPGPLGGDFASIIAQNKAERDRVKAITLLVKAACDDHPVQVEKIEELGQKAIKGKATPQDFELELLRSLRPTGPNNIAASRDESGLTTKVIEAAICKTLRLSDLDKQYDERTLDATDKHFRHGIGLQQLLFRAAAANGQHYDSVGNLRGLLKAAFGEGPGIRASGGFSTFSLSGVLSNTMNKFLVDNFNAVESVWRRISAIRPVNDFKTITSYSLTGDLQYSKVGPAGKITHGTLDASSYTNKAETYARMLGITRQDIINDDLGAFQAVPRKLGRGAGLKVNDVFWTLFLANSSFFAAGNSNVSTGGGSALGTADGAAINAAEVIFAALTDPDGKPLGIMPAIILAPPTLKNTAARWMGGQLIVTGADNTLPNINVYNGRYRVESSVYMENSSYTGYSAAAWYLLADPADLPVVEVCFLGGRDVPVIESADADFDTLGIQVRGYHDFGVAFQEPRGGVRSAGS